MIATRFWLGVALIMSGPGLSFLACAAETLYNQMLALARDNCKAYARDEMHRVMPSLKGLGPHAIEDQAQQLYGGCLGSSNQTVRNIDDMVQTGRVSGTQFNTCVEQVADGRHAQYGTFLVQRLFVCLRPRFERSVKLT